MANNKLYAYFDIDTGNLLAFSNEIRNEYEHKIEVTTEEYHRFVSGIERFSDWIVSRSKNVDSEFELVQKDKQHIFFKNNLFEKIINANANTELIIQCDIKSKSWVIFITDEFRQRIYDENISTGIRYKKVELYITVTKEPNFFLQQIFISIEQLINDKQIIPFVSGYETDINKVDIFIKNSNFSSGIWNESNE
jgi:hypothetical protein